MIYLGLGSNLPSSFGNRFQNINLALDLIKAKKVNIVKKSSFYETLSYPNKKDPKFINIIVAVQTNLSPKNLMSLLISVEEKLERKRNKKNDPRTCDIDIIDYNNINKSFKKNKDMLILPHPRSHKRNFVLLPLYEINKDWKHPKFKSKITELIMKLPINDLSTIKLI